MSNVPSANINLPEPIEQGVSRLSYGTAIALGLVGLPVGLAASKFSQSNNVPLWFLLFLTSLAAVAIALTRSRLASQGRVVALRASTKTGALSIGIGAGMIILGLRLAAGSFAALIGLIPVLASLLPALSLALLILALVPALGAMSNSTESDSHVQEDGRALALKATAFGLIVLGFSSAFYEGARQLPEPTIKVQPSRSPVIAPIDPKSLLPFQEQDLTPDKGLETIPIVRWKVKSIDNLGPRLDNAEVDLAPDGKTFAYLKSSLRDLMIVDLMQMKILHHAALHTDANVVRFSPDSERLLIITTGQDAIMNLMHVPSGKVTGLPRTLRAAVPTPPFAWWRENEILLQRAEQPEIFLLDKLESVSVAAVPAWTSLTAKEQQSWLAADGLVRANQARFQIRGVEIPSATFHPAHEGTPEWRTTSGPGWILMDAMPTTAKYLSNLQRYPDSRMIPILEGKALLHLHHTTADVVSFTTEEETQLTVSFAMPHDPKHEDCSPDVPLAMNDKSLVAAVYAPLKNPLNGQVVGPDRNHVRALVRFIEWKETKAKAVVEVSLAPLQSGDVIADAVRWTGYKPDILSRITLFTPWWAVVESGTTQPAATELASTVASIIPHHSSFDESGKGRKYRQFPHDVQFVPYDPNDLAKIREFIKAHHTKISLGNIDGFANDFGITVAPYYGRASINRSAILDDEKRQNSETRSATENIQGNIQIGVDADQSFLVCYLLDVTIEQKTGTTLHTHRDMTVRLNKTTAGFQIVSCSAKETEN